ncbi:unnamed protein product [Rhodiola kirilowii]
MKTLQQVLHMNKGFGDASYANNSTIQENIISMGQPIMTEAVLKLIQSVHCESLGLADLGCSSGPNSLKAVTEIANMIFSNHYSCRLQNLELRIYLNDLPCNDFNSIFSLLPELYTTSSKTDQFSCQPCLVLFTVGCSPAGVCTSFTHLQVFIGSPR